MKRSNTSFIIIVVMLVAALAVEGYLLLRPSLSRARRPAEAQAAIMAGQSQPIEEIGDPKAGIQVEFYAPLTLEWHQQTIALLRDYDRKHPGRIHARLMPMGRSDCDAEMQQRGFTCAVIFVKQRRPDGSWGEPSNRFTLPDGRQVELYQRPNQSDSTYKSEDVIAILDQLATARSRDPS